MPYVTKSHDPSLRERHSVRDALALGRTGGKDAPKQNAPVAIEDCVHSNRRDASAASEQATRQLKHEDMQSMRRHLQVGQAGRDRYEPEYAFARFWRAVPDQVSTAVHVARWTTRQTDLRESGR